MLNTLNDYITPNLASSPPLHLYHGIIIDTSYNCQLLAIQGRWHNTTSTKNPIKVHLPNGDHLQSIHTALMNLPDLTQEAHCSHLFTCIQSQSLISTISICNADRLDFFPILLCASLYIENPSSKAHKCHQASGLLISPLLIPH